MPTKDNTANRLKQIMQERNLKQVDIVNMVQPYCKKYGVKMNKSDISQYVKGKYEPSQDKLVVLGMALDVSESWLMGFDVEKSRKSFDTNSANEDLHILKRLSLLKPEDKSLVLDMIESLIKRSGV